MQDTERLIAGIAAGEEPALTALVARLGRPVRLFLARYLGSSADGEEVAQEVFLAIWRRAGSFDPTRGAAEAWLWRIARNAAIDRQRRQRLRWLIGLDPGTVETPDDAPGAERITGGKAALARVRAEIAALPDRPRQALLLAAVGGMDSAAIAAIMGTSRGSVEQLLVRARRRLRERLPEIDPREIGHD